MPQSVFAHGGSLANYIVPLGIVLVVVLWRNSRPRRLKIDRLWVTPAIYVVLLVLSLSAAPPMVTPLSVALLVAGFALGAVIGWQRGRFTQIHIHPETQDLTSRASPIGLIFIFAILVLRIAARSFLTGGAASMHLPVVAIGDAFLALAVGLLAATRFEIWLRATRLLEEARGSAAARRT